jgi:hypothetical protein
MQQLAYVYVSMYVCLFVHLWCFLNCIGFVHVNESVIVNEWGMEGSGHGLF